MPLRDTSGDLWSLQFIGETGRKHFLKGGRVHGCFHVISSGNASPAGLNARGLNLICEGFATAWRCFEAMGGVPAVVAFDAGNLLAVAKALREGYTKPVSSFAPMTIGKQRTILAGSKAHSKRQKQSAPRLRFLSSALVITGRRRDRFQ